MKRRIVNFVSDMIGCALESIVKAFEPYHPEDEELWQTDEPDRT